MQEKCTKKDLKNLSVALVESYCGSSSVPCLQSPAVGHNTVAKQCNLVIKFCIFNFNKYVCAKKLPVDRVNVKEANAEVQLFCDVEVL